jgi:hypothetical protein
MGLGEGHCVAAVGCGMVVDLLWWHGSLLSHHVLLLFMVLLPLLCR